VSYRERRGRLFEVAHQVGGGFGGFFDFGDAVDGGIGARELVGEDVGVGADDAEKVVESMGDGFHAVGGEVTIAMGVESKFHLISHSEMSLSFLFGMGFEKRGVEQISGELIERQTMRGAGLLSLFVEILDRGVKESEDRNGGVFGANFLDDAQTLEAPSMKINGEGIPIALGEDAKQIRG